MDSVKFAMQLKEVRRLLRKKRWFGSAILCTLGFIVLLAAFLALIFPIYRHKYQCKRPPIEGEAEPSPFPWDPLETQQQNRSLEIQNLSKTSLRLRNIVFAIQSSSKVWPTRKEFVKLWFKPGLMRGFVWVEEGIAIEAEDDQFLPPVMVSDDSYPMGIRLSRILLNTFRLRPPDSHWFVLCEDDTVFSTDNLMSVLAKYDPAELFYIGAKSDSHLENHDHAHSMAFSGAGIAISYGLAEALSNMLEACLERYPQVLRNDNRLHACITELGVPLTREPGFHQVKFHKPYSLIVNFVPKFLVRLREYNLDFINLGDYASCSLNQLGPPVELGCPVVSSFLQLADCSFAISTNASKGRFSFPSKHTAITFDIRGNAFGFLAAHPLAPFVSMHHADLLDPVFPELKTLDSLRLFMSAMETEPASFLQQSMCYNHTAKLSLSVSLGYVVQIFPNILFPRELQDPEVTFHAWNWRDHVGEFAIDTRPSSRSICDKPLLFYLRENHFDEGRNKIWTIYGRYQPLDKLKENAHCQSDNFFPKVQQVRVVHKPFQQQWHLIPRRQCCKLGGVKNGVLTIAMNPCKRGQRIYS
eukprot:Gb_36895 [translate_table: standard]